MSKDIRSFFKPLTTTKSSNASTNKEPLIPKSSPGKPSGKTLSKDKGKVEKTNKSPKSSVNRKSKKESPKSKPKKNEEKKKLEIVSSDSDTECVAVKQSEEKMKKSKSKPEVNKIEIVSSDSDSDIKTKKLKETCEIKKGLVNLKKLTKESQKVEIVSDDDSDFINQTPNANKKRKFQIDSDSEDDIKPVKQPKDKENLKLVNVSEIFSRKINQSKVKTAIVPPEIISKKKGKRVKTELGVHDDKNFEKTLIDLDDDDLFLQNEDILDKTIEGALNENLKEEVLKDSNLMNKTKVSEKPDHSKEKINSEDNCKLSKKRPLDNDEGGTPSKIKKSKINHTDSGFDDEERYEKKKYCSMQYQKYLNRSGPKNHGCKEIPKGKPDCLSNLTFMRTGVLDSLETDEFESLVKEHGGRVVGAVSKKVNYVVVGEEPGPAKLQKAESYKIPTISEDELLDMILQKSGMPKKYTVMKKTSSFEDAGINDSFVSNVSEEPLEKKEERSDIKKDDEKKPVEENKTEEKNEAETVVKDDVKSETVVKKHSKYEENLSLSEKYKPRDLKQIIGQQLSNSNMNRLRKWLELWHISEKRRKEKTVTQPKPWDKSNDGSYFKCALLSGPPGVGKTTTATLVAESLGFDIVEYNASDTRSKKLLQQEVATALNSKNITFFKTDNPSAHAKRVILMDEVDGMAGNEDRGGMQELISLIKTSKVPIICMCNDRNHQKMRTLANYCFDLRFEKPKPQQILGFVMSICTKEGINVTPQIAAEIINGTSCDIRQTLNQLSMLSNLDEGISLEQAQRDSANSKKDSILGPWQVCKIVFNEADQKDMSLIDKSRLFFYDYSMGPLFVQENYLKVQPHVEKKLTMKHVAAAAEAISMGASIDKKIRESNNWSLLDLQAIFSSVLPGHYMSGHFTGAIDFPSFLGKMSKGKKIKRMLMELSLHTRTQTSGGELAMNLDYSNALLTSIVTPLKGKGLEGVSEAVGVMKMYHLLREDLDNLVEVSSAPGQKNWLDGIESKVKAAFTRLYNKEVPLFSYSANEGVSKKAVSRLYDDEEFNDDENDAISETEDSVENDNLIKVKSKSKAAQSKRGTAKASTSKQVSKAKGRGKK